MGRLPESSLEVRLAATLFLLLLGLANLFGAWEVANFAAFTPRGVAATVGPSDHMNHEPSPPEVGEKPIDISRLNAPRHVIDRDLLVQDSHVHVPVYAMTAALLALIVFGLRLSSRARSTLVLLAFAAPFLDFVGLWGAHLDPRHGSSWGAVTVFGGGLMGIVYLVVLTLNLEQCWFQKWRKRDA
jgi:hypothetical protein